MLFTFRAVLLRAGSLQTFISCARLPAGLLLGSVNRHPGGARRQQLLLAPTVLRSLTVAGGTAAAVARGDFRLQQPQQGTPFRRAFSSSQQWVQN